MVKIAEMIVAYAQPLIDNTDGSIKEMELAITIAQTCWNLALLPEEAQKKALNEMGPELDMDEEEFADFRESILIPMIQRHKEFAPRIPNLNSWTTESMPP
ncbi:MAG: hypothetical protein JJU29_12325 [Verrucomicrobia bacterium]|nr:hypothetical protein [Verrucomicrobiota bacterium]MCH8510163.1 hypothetical protein [Kiritimatiellia bacterium]